MKVAWILVTVICCVRCEGGHRYIPTWKSLDARPLPSWYDDSKFGIFLHWGVYSVPSFGEEYSEWFWAYWRGKSQPLVDFMNKTYPPGFTYQNFASQFTTEFFNASAWADIFHGSGAKYVVLTSKHHEGFTMWPSKHSFSWNSMDVGPHRDLVSELSQAVRKKVDMHFGVYYSLYEWFNPLYNGDAKTHFNRSLFVDQKMLPELVELVETYKPDLIWADGDWEANDTYFKSRDFLTWLYNDSPVSSSIVVNDRWGIGIPCSHGGVFTCQDSYNPMTLQSHKWESCFPVDRHSWGYRRNAPISSYRTTQELITHLIRTVSCGGNLLLNIGPTKEGLISPIFQDRLQGIGEWLEVNGEAIYKTKPWASQNDSLNGDVWYTASKYKDFTNVKESIRVTNVYAISLKWPTNNVLQIRDLAKYISVNQTKAYLLGNEKMHLKWTKTDEGVFVRFPDMSLIKSLWAWSVKFTNIKL